MNPDAIYEVLGLPPRTILIHQVHFDGIARTLILECAYDPDEPQLFTLIFEDVWKFHWVIIDEEAPVTPPAQVINMMIGKPDYQEEALIHADLFEMLFIYRAFTIQ